MGRAKPIVAGIVIVAVAMTVAIARHGRDRGGAGELPHLVLYCATDREIVQDLVEQFQRESGIRVDAKYDTESAKAVGLVQAIRQERGHPQCDVLWGGGPFFCTMLADDGCLAPAPADLVAAQGATPHDPQGRWLGFAAAYRILIVNTDALPNAADRPRSYLDLADPKFKGHVGIANPIFGGMGAHVAALFATAGEDSTRRWLRGLRANDCAICAGMADVKNRVASGELWAGITSTIDAHVAVVGGKPVAVVFPDQGPGEIGCMNGYNAVAMIAGGPHPREAAAFLRFLLTARTERVLAEGPGQNVGMLPGSVAERVGPAWIPRDVRTMDVDWAKAVRMHPAAQAAVKELLLGR